MTDPDNKVLRWLVAAEDTGRIITIVSMTGLVFYQVIARIFFKWSSPALEEAARFIMIWSIFIGAVVTTREDSHIKMGGIFKGPQGEVWFELISKIVTFIFLCVFVAWSYEFAAYSLRKEMNSIVLGVPLVVVHICFLVTGVLMAFHTLVHLINRVGRVIHFYRGDRL
jgi:TRAP-type C4-dicarboxylate transport system permease small subunit